MCHLLKSKLVAKPKLQAFDFSYWKGSHAPALRVVLQVLESQMENHFFNFTSMRVPNCGILFIRGKNSKQ